MLALLPLSGCGDASDPAPSSDPTEAVIDAPTEPEAPPEDVGAEDISAEELSQKLRVALRDVKTMRAVTTESAVEGDDEITVTTAVEVDLSSRPEASRTLTDCEGALCHDSGYVTEETPTRLTIGQNVYDWWDNQWVPTSVQPGEPRHELDAIKRLVADIDEVVSATDVELEDRTPATTYALRVRRPGRHVLSPSYTLEITVGSDWLVREVVRGGAGDGLFDGSTQVFEFDVEVAPIEHPSVG